MAARHTTEVHQEVQMWESKEVIPIMELQAAPKTLEEHQVGPRWLEAHQEDQGWLEAHQEDLIWLEVLQVDQIRTTHKVGRHILISPIKIIRLIWLLVDQRQEVHLKIQTDRLELMVNSTIDIQSANKLRFTGTHLFIKEMKWILNLKQTR